MSHPLEKFLRERIKNDTRPPEHRDLFQAAAKRKRTTLRDASVLTPQAAALAIKQYTLGMPDNAGNTVRRVLKQGPMLRSAIKQGGVGDCYFLMAILGAILVDPLWFDKYNILPINLPDGDPGVLVYFYERRTNSIAQLTMSQETSTSYNNPNDDDIRPEILEKGYAFFRRNINDYLQLDTGGGTEGGDAFGFRSIAARQQAEPAAAWIDKHRAARRFVTIITSINARILVARHAYAALDGRTLINTWDGSLDVPVLESTLQNPNEVVVMYALEPAGILPLLPAASIVIPAPDPMPRPTPIEPAPQPEKPMPPKLNFTQPAPGSDPNNIVVAGKVGTPVPLAFAHDADTVVMTTPGSNPLILSKAPETSYDGWVSTIGTTAKTFTYTATKGGEKTVKTVTLKPGDVVTPTPPVNPSSIASFTFDAKARVLTITREDNTVQAIR